MKITTLIACCLALVLGALPRAARAEEVSFDFFYNSLADDGAWYNTPEYGYVWQPDIAYKTDKWRPYTDGYWAQTEDGWTWVSYENFGWATYHYGRWTRIKDTGWVWIPGYNWGPGWVSWRTNDDVVGWAPLPPKRERKVYEGRVVSDEEQGRTSLSVNYNDVELDDSSAYTPAVDNEYDIGPQNYCFVESRNFGAPVLSEVLLSPERNFGCVEDTVNVTNIIYRRDGERTIIYNNGPDFEFFNRRSERPLQQLHIERRDDIAFVRDSIRGGNNPTLVRNGVLQVASPFIARGAVNFEQVRPPRIKENLPRAEILRGWQGVRADPQQVQRLHERIREGAGVPPPPVTVNQQSFQNSAASKIPAQPLVQPQIPAAPGGRRDRTGNVPPTARPGVVNPPGAPAAGPRPEVSDAERAARRDARQREREQRQAVGTNGQAVPPTPDGPGQPRAVRRDARQAGRAQAGPTGVPPQPAGATPPAAEAGAGTVQEQRAARRQAREQQAQQAAQQEKAAAAQQETARQERRAARQQEKAQPGPAQPPTAPPANAITAEERQQRRAERQQQRAAAEQAPQQNAAQEQERQQRRAERQQQRGVAEQQNAQQQQQRSAEVQQQRQERQQQRAAQQQQAAPPQPNPGQQQERQQRREERQQQAAPPQPQPQPQGTPDDKKKHPGQS